MAESRHGRFPRVLKRLAPLLLAAWPAAATPPVPPVGPDPLPRFALFGWLSPPPDSTTPERIAEMAALGLDVLLPVQDEAGRRADNLRRLDLAAPLGLRGLVFDERLRLAHHLGLTTPLAQAMFDSVAATYRDHPGLLGWYLGDEPRPPWDTLAIVHRALRARDPGHVTWNNLLGRMAFASAAEFRAYLDGYLDSIPAAVVCVDHYEFLAHGDRGQFFENAAVTRAAADARGLPFWAIVQLVEHGGYRELSAGELRWQVSQLLAYGARGIGYFTYWTPSPDSAWDWQPAIIGPDGRRTHWYDVLLPFHARLRPAGERVAGFRWLSAQATPPAPPGAEAFAGDDWLAGVEGRVTVGRFVEADGTPHLVVGNRDSLADQAVTLRLRGATGVTRLDSAVVMASEPDGGSRRVTLTLAPGDFALLRIEGTAGEAGLTLGPVLALAGHPARGRARFALARVGGGARLEIFDPLGRRAWSVTLAPGTTHAEWDGRRDDGRPAPAGLYLARLSDHRGRAAMRLTWLGR